MYAAGGLLGMCLRYSSLLKARKQIYYETMPVLHGSNSFSFCTPHRWNKFIGATKSNRHLIKWMHLDIHLFGHRDDSLWRTRLTLKGLKELYISITPQYYRTQEQYEYMKTYLSLNFRHHPIHVGFYQSSS